MRFRVSVLIIVFLFAGCYGPITGTVVDAETGKPIEGAIVLIEWSIKKGFGLTYTETYKVVEKVTDKEGKFRVCGVLNPWVNPPIVVVYKKGYVAWRNDYIFPSYEERNDFQWRSNYVFRLDHFLKKYLHTKHIDFMRMSGLSLSSTKIDQALSWEFALEQREGILYGKIIDEKKSEKYIATEIWDEVAKRIYLQNGDNE